MWQQHLRGVVAALLLLFANPITPLRADDRAASRAIQEEIWALPLPLPMFAYLVRSFKPEPTPGQSHHRLRRRPWRPRRQQAEQQLRARQTRGSDR